MRSARSRILLVALACALAACGARSMLGVASSSSPGAGGAGGAGGAPASTSSSSASFNSSSVSSASSSVSSTSSSVSSASSSTGEVCTPEVCDGVDNDCNGLIDDGNPGGGFACDTGQPGPCATGVTLCKGGAIVCVSTVPPVAEVCGDGIDNDCNGVVDDGCVTGCSDGSREGFVDQAMYPHIAGCSGGWSVPGLIGIATPTCGRLAGNSSVNPSGVGCSVADLCAKGFHVCTSAADVAARSPTGCAGAANAPGLFFVTAQSSNGCGQCALGTITDPSLCDGCGCNAGCAQTKLTANDLFGCGSLGDAVVAPCGVLDRFSNNLCTALTPAWSCGSDGCSEANGVMKLSSSDGGVLCCED